MPLEDRAKIFSPFDPLQGFREALREKEREVEQEAQAGDPSGSMKAWDTGAGCAKTRFE